MAHAMDPVTFTATDYAFSGPDQIPAGVTTLHMKNQGDDLHHIQLIRLMDGKTVEDFKGALKADPMGLNLPKWIKHFGGPNAAVPGEGANGTVNLEPGTYLVTCLIPNTEGVIHASLGMIKTLNVVKSDQAVPAIARGDVEIILSDFVFSVNPALKSGKQTLRVVNKGKQAHEILLVMLPPDTSVKSFGNFFLPDAPPPDGPPPGKPIGGISGIEPGATASFEVDLPPGRYGVICFFIDQGRFHFEKGMMLDVEVE
ncbi:MAG TPA: hypothetical protein VLB09_03845 [Nitrospiria bacterium]|nr:hypothetical protein [Nitrospiria bacterium]